MSEPQPGALSAGQIFHGRYEIVRCLKTGGMGAVYECIHITTRKHRALKVMLPQILADTGMRDRFQLEARVTADIESEHIVETFDAGVDDATGAPFLVMELLRGEDLRSILKKRGALPASETVLLLSQAALALDKTHAAGIVHRDLKPDNLFVTIRDDGTPRLKVLDFGIAKVVAGAGHSVQQTAMIGTPLYMSHEQILGEGTIGPRADIYALGHIAFTLLTGKPYWKDEQLASPAIYTFLGKVMAGVVEPATERAGRRGVTLPPAFDAWFTQATARAASERFEKASTLVHELAVVLNVAGQRLGSLPFLLPDSRGLVPSLPDSAPMIAVPVLAAVPTAPIVAPAPTVTEAPTLVASSNSIGAPPKRPRSRLPLAVAGLGALGAAGLGVLVVAMRSHAPGPSASTAATGTMAASAPTPARSAPEPVPAATPSAMPSPTLLVDVPAVITSPVPAPPRPKPAPVKPVAATQACNPPYVMNSAGHRIMKPECL
jgi:eukaryotic-like serine/threonine-protein kinase